MTLRLVGLGSFSGGDDQVGLLAASRLRATLPAAIEVTTDTTGGARLCELADGVDTLMLLDALRATPEWPAGTLVRWRYPRDRHQLQAATLSTTHSISVAQGLELAQALGRLPREVLIHALAVAHFKPGAPLNSSLQQPLERWIRAIHRDALQQWTPVPQP